MHTFLVGMDGLMPSKYDEETRARAVRLVRDHVGDYDSEFAAIKAVASRLGMSTEALRRWVRQAEVDAGQAVGVTSESAKEIRQLKRKNAELEQTIEILKAATGRVRSPAYQDFLRAGVRPATPLICRFIAEHPCCPTGARR